MDPLEQKIKIIITEDMAIFRKGIRNFLETKNDIDIIAEAIHGKDLLDKLETLSPDIILLNIQMPVMDGVTTLPFLKNRFPHIKIIILSFLNDKSIIKKTIKLGANAYVTKESGGEAIYQAISALKENWFYMNNVVMDAFTKRELPPVL